VHAEAAAAGDGTGLARGRAPEIEVLDLEHAPMRGGHKGSQARGDEGDAVPASERTNGSGSVSARRSVLERQSDEAPSTATPAMRGITTLAVLAVALVAAIASYDHQRALAELAGEGWRVWLLPVSVDGLVLAASMSMLVRRRAGLPAGALAWTSLLAGIGASLAANVAAADPTPVGRFVAAWPPVALLLAWELLMQVRASSAAASGPR